MILYWGIFFDAKVNKQLVELSELFGMLLPKITPNLHVTFGFKPDRLLKNLIGKEIEIIVDGIGCDGNNNGVRVVLPIEYISHYKGAEVPHITISLSQGSRAVNTRNLQFMNIEPFTIKGHFDYVED